MRRPQHGFSMIEMMIAIVLSTVVITAAVSLFMANRGTNNTTAAVSAIADNGRIAMNFLSSSIRSAGYMACNATNAMHGAPVAGATRQLNVLSAGASPIQHAYTSALGGFEAGSTPPNNAAAVPVAASPPVGAAVAGDSTLGDWNGAGLDSKLSGLVTQGSDVLLVRESIPGIAPDYIAADYAPGATTVNLNSTAGLQKNQFAVISDCVISTAFQITSVNASSIGFPSSLLWGYEWNSSITPVDMYVYFVGPGRDQDSSLWMWDEWTGTFSELVPDVENMQVLYGIPVSTPNVATQYVTAENVTNFNAVTSVKVGLLVASPPGAAALTIPAVAPTYTSLYTKLQAPKDGRMRKVLETTIAIRSATQAGTN